MIRILRFWLNYCCASLVVTLLKFRSNAKLYFFLPCINLPSKCSKIFWVLVEQLYFLSLPHNQHVFRQNGFSIHAFVRNTILRARLHPMHYILQIRLDALAYRLKTCTSWHINVRLSLFLYI